MFVELLTATTTRKSLESDTKVTQNAISSDKQEIDSNFFNAIVEALANIKNN